MAGLTTPQAFSHRLSPSERPSTGILGLLATQVLMEVRRYRRLPEYFIGVVVLPVILYTMFGLPEAGKVLPRGTDVGAMMFVSFGCYGVVSQALFSFGGELAAERGKGWLRRLRATPMPMWVYFAGKVALNLVFTAVTLVGMAAVAVVAGGVSFDPLRLLACGGLIVTGVLAFSTMGSAIAYWVRPRAVATIVNLVFLPLSFLSGFFYPLDQLPGVFTTIAQALPTHHFGLLAWGLMGPAEDMDAFGNPATGSTTLHVVVVLAWWSACGLLTVLGYRRDLDRERS
ncbi:ABC transporter permease [Segeticoccus rhizosphaerae]|uniref:ABC transporter permease n=1 Tax=Segeticoccus rhizosphaerae TaxID=1104777 RepID=UPI0010C0ECFD|nr:ABC transporter permease [Ornithinicoccus soli]